MQACLAEGVAICDAHPDLEVFRLRLGKAINYEYNEDSQTGLFQRRDPREGALTCSCTSLCTDHTHSRRSCVGYRTRYGVPRLLDWLSYLYSPTAMNKLEKVALRYARRTGRPLVLIVNNVQFFKNDDEGRNMLLQLQQHAESWAASGKLLDFLT